MAKELSKDVLNRLARLGARARLDELEAERRAILKAFPGLGGGRKGAVAETPAAPAKPAKKARKKRNVSAAARKAASDRMKQYWAAKKQAQP